MDFVPGALVAGRYRLRKMVGSGGMGEVWAGDDVKNGVKVAVKHLLPAAAKHHEVVARFKREAFLLGKIESEYVSRVVDFFDDETFGLVLVMEFIEGPSLAHILEQRTLTVEEAVDLSVDLLRALSQLHASKIVHRDLKPGNIIMRSMPHGRNQATVVDFGISRLLADKGENEVTGITRANIALGTVEYMAPEQILNSRDVTAVTDLYAVGIILFRAIKGHHAFGDRRGEELARAKLIEDAPALETGRADDLAKGLCAVVARALKKKPSHRFASADEMLAVVEGLQRMSHNALDLDDATTDSGETAVKRSPLAGVDEDDGPGTLAMASPHAGGVRPHGRGGTGMIQAPLPAAGAPARPPPARGPAPPSASPMAARPSAPGPAPGGPRASGLDWSSARDESKRAPEVRAPLPSISESQPRGSLPSISESQPRGSLPSIPESMPRGSLPSIPEAPRSGAEREGAPSPRASLASLHEAAPVIAPPPRSELTMERPAFGSKGTIALAILTSFAVGAAIGLIVAPNSAPASKPEACPSCAPAGSDTCAPTGAAATAPTAKATALETSTATPTTAKATASSASTAKPILTGKLSSLPGTAPPPPPPPKPPPTAVPTFDGLGEDDPPPPPKAPPPPPAIPAPEL
ncbi:MAG: protein kinase [Polyangiaceae bacterium]|nr:protein kinase [Polyangiaceae bacterium]